MSGYYGGKRGMRYGHGTNPETKCREVFTGKCDVRLNKSQDNALSKLAERYGVSRSDVMRRALDNMLKFNEME